MSVLAAPLLSMSFNGREYQCLGDGAGGMKSGGYENEHAPNGNPATGRTIMTPTSWRVPDQGIVIDITTDDFEFLESLKDSGQDIDIVWTFVGDISYGGTGIIEGELSYDPMTASTSITAAGAGKAEKL
jgi:hypothetical protein